MKQILNARNKGTILESMAIDYLKNKGVLLIQRNFCCKLGEIDLICKDQNELIFIEVRYRKNNTYGNAEESINYKKRQKLIKAALYFLQNTKKYDNSPCRFDVIAINGNIINPNIEWIQNAIIQG